MDEMVKRMKEQKPVPVQPLNTAPLEAAITKGITRLQQTIEAQPKPVVHERRILLFPEYGAKEYYKTVLGRLCFGAFSVIIATFLFLLCKEFIQDWSDRRSGERELNAYKNGWQRLYKQSDTKEKKKMDDIANGK